MIFKELFKNARYIAASEKNVYPYFRKEFTVDTKITKAELTVSILGFGEVYCNGKKVNDDLYITPYSQYNKQSLEDVNEPFKKDYYFSEDHNYSIYASKYDITDSIVHGKNVIGFVVSGGWYLSGKDKHGNFRNYGDLAVCFVLELTTSDGSVIEIVSDADAKWHRNFLTLSGIFNESQDENLEIMDFSEADYDAKCWSNVVLRDAPQAEYLTDEYPRQIIEKYITPKLIKEGDDFKIYDLGINSTGYPIITTSPCKNVTLECTYSEEKTDDNELDEKNVFAQKTIFVTDGRTTHNLRFTWHGFRYFKITTSEKVDFDCSSVAIVHADVNNTSKFTCDEETVNWLYDCYVNSQLTNYQCGVPCDCPHIERKGYTGDGQLLCELGMMLFDSKLLYKKWLHDISDAQDKITGSVAYTAPIFIGCGGGPGGWSIAIVNVPYYYYKSYGDVDVLREFYPNMLKYIDYLKSKSENDIVMSGQPNAWCLGEWHTREKVVIPHEFVNSCFHCIALLRMQEICRIIGRDSDIAMLSARYDAVSAAIKRDYLDDATGDYCGNQQGANSFAIAAGFADSRAVDRLIEFYREEKSFNVGIFGLDFVSQVLLENGQGDLFIEMLNADKEGCFLKWKQNGATTLYEDWINARSHNHPMYGSVVKYFYKYILGIRQCDGASSYREITVSPIRFEKINKASGELQTASGTVKVAYERVDDKTEYVIEVPQAVSAKFCYGDIEKNLTSGVNNIVVYN